MAVRELTKRYGDRTVLHGVDLDVQDGQICGFVGPNGAGKTTMMRLIMGVLEPTGGRITWDGQRLTAALRKRFGYMPEERGLYAKHRVGDQIRYFARLFGLTPVSARDRADELMERLGITGYRDQELQALSLGNQQRVQLAVALVHRPSLLVLDEPFSGLDPVAVDSLAELLREYRDAGAPILFSSHQLDVVERLIDSVAIIVDGRLVANGRVDEILHGQRNTVGVRLADPVPGWTERIPATVVDRDGDRVVLEPVGDPNDVLTAVLREGQVLEFATRQPRLVDLFRELVG